MKTLTSATVKNDLSHVLEMVRQGEEIVISYGRKKEKIAVIVPYKKYTQNRVSRKLGTLEGKASYKIKKGFKTSDEDMLTL
jgi:prevent-host-death family protein